MLVRRLSQSGASLLSRAVAAQTPAVGAVTTRVSHIHSKTNEMPEDAPFLGLANKIGEGFEFDPTAAKQAANQSGLPEQIYEPSIPHVLPVTRLFMENETIRDVLIFDETKRQKPRLSWYNPYDTTWAPTDWFSDGLMADMKYYFGDEGMQCKDKK